MEKKKYTPEELKQLKYLVELDYFIDNKDNFLPTDIYVIEENFDKFFVTWKKLVKDEMKMELESRKENLKYTFYMQIYRTAKDDSYLVKLLKDHRNLKEDEIKIAIKKFHSIVKEVFLIPNLTLSAFEDLPENFRQNYASLQVSQDNHTNRKGKAWRDKLYDFGKEEFYNNNDIDQNKTLALKAGFDKLPDKEQYKNEFNAKFKSIYDKFLRSF